MFRLSIAMSFIGFSVFCQAQKETVDTVKPANTWFNGDSAHRNFEIDAYFPGGNQAWNRFISRHLKYPSSAVKNNIQGVVIVQFVVDAEGSVTDVKAVSGPLELWLPAENVIRQSGKWIPAEQNGKKVRAVKKQPFVFRL